MIIPPPKISVLMSVYKEPLNWVTEAIESILNQSFSDFEFIIINDNPGSVELKSFLEDYSKKDIRIKIVTNPHNLGLTKSLNIGLSQCQGEYIARMDADDISLPERFQEQSNYLDMNSRVGIVGSWTIMSGIKNGKAQLPVNNGDIKAYQIFAAPFDHPATMMRKSTLIDHAIKYDESLLHAQDQQLWYELSKVCDFANIPRYLFIHRYNSQQISKIHRKSQKDTIRNVRTKMVKEILQQFGFSDVKFSELSFSSLKVMTKIVSNMNVNDDQIKKWAMTVKVISLKLNRYNIMTLIDFLKSGLYLLPGWSFRDILRIFYKHMNKNYYDPISFQ